MDDREANKEPVYVISVAARLADVHPQTLRIYERKGLINPARIHNRRRYSEADLEQARLIQELTQKMGLNLAGVKMILDMRMSMEGMRERLRSMEDEIEVMKRDMEERVNQARASLRNDIVHVPRGQIALMNINDPFRKARLLRQRGR
jgi:MerR family transcriptional regulator, heat shock protein HspR